MSKSRKQNSQTRPEIHYEVRSRGPFQHQSIVYRPVKQSKQPIIMPDPRSCFYSRIMKMIKKLK